MKHFTKTLLVILSMPLLAVSQITEKHSYDSAFQSAYQVCPDVPQGLLEAISFTNTHCNHLTDDNYFHDGPEAMPRAYGLMGLVKDGKGYFRENLHLVSKLSGISEAEILQSPAKNVMAYAKAFDRLVKANKATNIQCYLSVIQQLSELPIGEEKDVYPVQSMLYSVCLFMNDAEQAEKYDFPKYDIDLKSVFAEHYDMLTAPELSVNRGADYPSAIWDPAPECNFSNRTSPVSAVAIHYTEGSYAGCISWYLVRNICSRYAAIDGHRTFYRDTLDNGQCLNNGVHDLGGETACTKIRGHQHFPDQSHTDPGPYWDWNYYYKLINEGTPVTVLQGSEGRLDHQNYGDDERKIWVIRGPEMSTIQLNFSSFDLEPNYDFLWIYDGDNVYAPKIGRWNTRTPGTVKASGNVMCVEFRSDCATTNTGWQASWKALSSEPIEPETPEEPEQALESSVTPNPTNGKFTVQSDSEGFSDVVVYDLYGNQMTPIIRFVKSVEVDASTWPSGVYVVNYGTPVTMGKVVRLVKR